MCTWSKTTLFFEKKEDNVPICSVDCQKKKKSLFAVYKQRLNKLKWTGVKI